MAQTTRTFADFDLNFTPHPLSGDLVLKTNELAIKQAVKNLILTDFYERLFHPEIGSLVKSMLFEPFSPLTRAMLIKTITDTIINHEPRVNLIRVDVAEEIDSHELRVDVVFSIVNTSTPINLNFLIDRTR